MTKFSYKDSHTDKELLEFEKFLEKEIIKINKEYIKQIGNGNQEYLHISFISDDIDGWFMNVANNYFEAGKPKVDCVWRMKR